MKDILHPLCLIIAGAGFLVLLRDVKRDRRDIALVALAASFLASALSYAVSITWVWVRIDALFGVPNIVVPLAQSFVIVVFALQGIVITYWSKPHAEARRRSRQLLILGAVVIVGMAVLFTLLTPATQRPTDFALYYAHDPAYQGYVLLYFGTYTVAEIYLARSCWKYARAATNLSIVFGLRLVTVGALITLVYSGLRIAAVVGAEVGFSVDHLNNLSWACGDIGATMTQLGYFLPVIATRMGALHSFVYQHYCYFRLDKLWAALVRMDPGLVLNPPVSQREYLRTRRSVQYPLIRRRTEIRDGQSALRPYLSPAARTEAEAARRQEGLSGAKFAAAVTADQLRHAMILHEQQKPVAEQAEYADAGLHLESVKAEQKHLLRVASFFSPPPPDTPTGSSQLSTTPGVRT
ncbi:MULTISPECIES: MAB_1171c family putative transporter [unclassified Streptomyces]|uniref:MAB_1171c family putative transporter n=1 Tax=unclassified Streptomyces TaxID=2593676 RepID=UPI0035D61CA0